MKKINLEIINENFEELTNKVNQLEKQLKKQNNVLTDENNKEEKAKLSELSTEEIIKLFNEN